MLLFHTQTNIHDNLHDVVMTPSLDDIPTQFCLAFTVLYFYYLHVNPWAMVDYNIKQ